MSEFWLHFYHPPGLVIRLCIIPTAIRKPFFVLYATRANPRPILYRKLGDLLRFDPGEIIKWTKKKSD